MDDVALIIRLGAILSGSVLVYCGLWNLKFSDKGLVGTALVVLGFCLFLWGVNSIVEREVEKRLKSFATTEGT